MEKIDAAGFALMRKVRMLNHCARRIAVIISPAA
jgi:hypothetical protein